MSWLIKNLSSHIKLHDVLVKSVFLRASHHIPILSCYILFSPLWPSIHWGVLKHLSFLKKLKGQYLNVLRNSDVNQTQEQVLPLRHRIIEQSSQKLECVSIFIPTSLQTLDSFCGNLTIQYYKIDSELWWFSALHYLLRLWVASLYLCIVLYNHNVQFHSISVSCSSGFMAPLLMAMPLTAEASASKIPPYLTKLWSDIFNVDNVFFKAGIIPVPLQHG